MPLTHFVQNSLKCFCLLLKREESGYYEAVGDSGNMTAKLHEIEIALKDQGFLVEGRQYIMYMLFFYFY